MFGINPYLIIGLMIAALAIGAGGYAKGRSDGAAKCEMRIAALTKASQKAKDAEAAKAHTAAADLEKENADANEENRVREVVVTKIVDRPVYRNTCFDADGLREANAALTGASADPAKPDKSVP